LHFKSFNFKILKKLIIILSFLFFVSFSFSQINYKQIKIDTTKTNNLYFKFNNNNFLKNNEYFNRFNRGETLLGYYFIPQFEYIPLKNVRINAGAFMLNFSGKDNLYKFSPFFRFNYQINSNLNLIMGNIYGSRYHKLIEPIFSNDLYLKHNNEAGLQFLYISKHLSSDLWCDWEYASLDGDSTREKMTIGNSSKYKFIDTKKFKISVLYQMILSHKGGQVNRGSYVQSIFNTAEGLEIKTNLQKLNIGIQGFYLTYNDFSPEIHYNYTYGWAIYNKLFLTYSDFKLSGGFWYSEHFIPAKGDYFFSSKSSYYRNYYEPNRNLITARIEYNKKVAKGFFVNFAYEGYYDNFNYTYDYFYKLYLIFNREFFIKKVNK